MAEVIYRCRCGLISNYGSLAPAPCIGCPECGSTMSKDPLHYRVPVAHSYRVWDQERCEYCLRTKLELEPPEED